MPFGLDPGLAAVLGVALFVAAFVRGYSGFGFSAVFIAFAALLTNPLPLIPVVFLCEILMTAVQARGIRGAVDWRRAGLMLIGAALAVPLSVLALSHASPETARLVVSAIIGCLSLVLLIGWQLRRPLGAAGQVSVGIASGLANGAGVGGLPVAALLAAQPIPAAMFRATLVVYITGLDLMTLPIMGVAGLVSGQTLLAAAMALPILTAGILLGGRHFLAASPQAFRRSAVLLLLVLAVLGVTRALLS
nr:sulfite exporter TauE/SafE family protein [Frigidibacter sp. ROC022]